MKHIISCGILLLLIGCSNTKENVNIEKLINDNKENSLFLTFWKGMSDKEFERVKSYENSNGTLKDGIFYLNDKFPFKVYHGGNSITLTYEDEQWSNYTGDPYYVWDYIKSGNPSNYIDIENTLVNLFNSKYKLIINNNNKFDLSQYDEFITTESRVFPNNKEHNINMQWQDTIHENEKVIILRSNYYFLDKNYNYHTSQSGASSTFFNDKKNKKAKIANCHISVTYEFLNDYLKRIKKHEESTLNAKKMTKKRHEQMLEQKRKKDSIIKIHNNHL